MCDPKHGFLTTFDQSAGLMRLAIKAVRPNFSGLLKNIDVTIVLERFPFVGKGVRTLNLRVEPCLKGETINMTVVRLVKAGHTPEGTGELAGFLHDHPKKVEEWNWVFAKRQRPWWYPDPEGNNRVTGASVVGNYCRLWRCFHPNLQYDGPCGIIVSSPLQ